MKLIELPLEQCHDVEMCQRYYDEGYIYGCECGESYRSQQAAENCGKCRIYLKEIPTKVYKLIGE